MKLSVKDFEKLDIKEKRYLYNLTFRGESGMRETMNSPSVYDMKIIFVREGEKILGWGLFSETHDKRKRPRIMIYVSRINRRRGIGTKILKKAMSFSKKRVKIGIHDDASESFYEGFGFTEAKDGFL